METSATETRPPWVGFTTYWNFLQQLHDHRPVPQLLDRAVMGSRGGSTRTELYVALRFFGLMDEDKRPTPTLLELVENLSPESFKPLVEAHYKPVIDLDLRTATPSQVGDRLSDIGSTPSTVTRARTFFLKAAEHVGIEVGKTLLNAPAGPPRKKASRRKAKANQLQETPPPPPTPVRSLPTIVEGLIERLPAKGETWTPKEAEEWLALARPALAFSYDFEYEKKNE
jgi:hypothetical protein